MPTIEESICVKARALRSEISREVPTSPRFPALRGWVPIVILPAVVLLFTPDHWPRWVLMWSLAAAIFVGFKWMTWRRRTNRAASWWRHAGYLLAWPGLDAAAFLGPGRLPRQDFPSTREWISAGAKLLAGGALFWGLSRLARTDRAMLLGWVGMAGLILMLHCGVFHLLSCFWRTLGVDARRLMNNPLAATSLSEFWSKRWNTAFRDLTHCFLFRPLTPWLGARGAIAAGFVFSGLVHDLVISVPAGGGYGWPTFFFVFQGSALLVERSRLGRALGLGRGWRGWIFTALCVIAPAYGLFHPPFMRKVVVPFMTVLGGGGTP